MSSAAPRAGLDLESARSDYDALVARGMTLNLTRGQPDATVRLAPTFPVLGEVEAAMAGVAVCLRLALASSGTAGR